MESYIIITIIFGVLTFGILFLLYFINHLISLKNRVLNNYKNVYSYLETRAEVLKEMIEYIKKNLEHEHHSIKKYENAIEVIKSAKNLKEDMKNVKKTKDMITKFIELEKTYPYLKENDQFNKIKDRALTNEGRIEYSVETYDKGVRDYNNYQNIRLVNLLSKVLRFSKYDYYNK